MQRTLFLTTFCLLIGGGGGLALAQTAPVRPAPEAVQNLQAAREADQIWDALQISSMMPVIRDEAVQQADIVAEIMFQRGGAGQWREVVAGIHDPRRLQEVFRSGLEHALEGRSEDEIGAAVAFYEDGLGKRLAEIELSARLALLNEGVEEDAKDAFAAAVARDDPRIDQIRRLIDTADLIEPNVAGALNAALAFSQGFADGDGYQMPMSEGQILSEVALQEPEIRAETIDWMESYLFLAYSAITDQELETYIDFASSPAGETLASVLFEAFDGVFRQAARQMGRAAAAQMDARAL